MSSLFERVNHLKKVNEYNENRKADPSYFKVNEITELFDKLGIKWYRDMTYWQLRFNYNGRKHIIHGYEEDDRLGGYLYNRNYYDTQKDMINHIKENLLVRS